VVRYVVLLLERTRLKRCGNNIITIIIIIVIIVATAVTEGNLKHLISGIQCIGLGLTATAYEPRTCRK
jgi:uncharacterized protein YqhQ